MGLKTVAKIQNICISTNVIAKFSEDLVRKQLLESLPHFVFVADDDPEFL